METAESRFASEMNSEGNMGDMRESRRQRRPVRPAFSSNFASTEGRFIPDKDPPAPPPGTYDVHMSWAAKGVPVMKETKVKTLKTSDTPMPGPGDYSIASPFGKKSQNRRNLMGSAVERFSSAGLSKDAGMTPGPDQYDPYPMHGSLIRPSHNVYLSSGY